MAHRNWRKAEDGSFKTKDPAIGRYSWRARDALQTPEVKDEDIRRGGRRRLSSPHTEKTKRHAR